MNEFVIKNGFISKDDSVVEGGLSAIVFSGGTIYSGSTNLYDIFLTTSDGNDITRVQPGNNITTGGTGNAPTINLISSPLINNLTSSGTSQLNTVTAVSISASTIFSGGSDLSSIFATQSDSTSLRNQLSTKVNKSGDTMTGQLTTSALSSIVISGGTLFSGSTDLYSIFSQTDTNDITRVQPGNNITTGGTGNIPIISLVANPLLNSIVLSGVSSLGIFSATTISGNTFISGSTNLYDIFAVQGGSGESNTASNLGAMGFFTQKSGVDLQFKGFSAGTNMLVTSSSTVNAIAVTSEPIFTSLYATTISGATVYSGSTNLYDIFPKMKQTEVDFGDMPVSNATFIIIDSSVNINSMLIAQVAMVAPTGKDVDEITMDNLQIRCAPSGGTFEMYIETADGSYLADKFKINYTVG